jgi:hypothetical protein
MGVPFQEVLRTGRINSSGAETPVHRDGADDEVVGWFYLSETVGVRLGLRKLI